MTDLADQLILAADNYRVGYEISPELLIEAAQRIKELEELERDRQEIANDVMKRALNNE